MTHKSMGITVLVVCCIAIGIAAFTGCSNNPVGDPTGTVPGTVGAAGNGLTGNANLRFEIAVRQDTDPSGPRATIKSAKATPAQVTCTVTSVNLRGAGQRTLRQEQTVSVSSSGTAVVTFQNLPELPTIGQVSITGGDVDGYTDFKGAVDLHAGANTMVVNPVGSRMINEVAAHIVSNCINSDDMIANAPANLAEVARQVATGIDRTASDTYIQALNRFAQVAVNSPTFYYLAMSVDQAQLVGQQSGVQKWSKTATDFFSSTELWGTTISELKVASVLRQGLDGFGYVTWKHNTLSPFGIVKVKTDTGARLAYCRNMGRCDQAFVLADGSVIVGGTNDDRRCPILFRWNGQGAASTESNSSGAATGLMWQRLFSELTANTAVPHPSVEFIAFDGNRTVTVQVRDPSLGLTRTYRIDTETGLGEPTVGGIRMLAYATPGDRKVDLTWNFVTGATSYNLYWANSPNVNKTNGTKIVCSSPLYAHTALTNGTPYYYVVTAVTQSGESADSPVVMATPRAASELPAAPSNVLASATNQRINVSWPAVAGATSYNIYWANATGVKRNTGNRLTNVTSPYQHLGLTNGVAYYYVVTAVNANGESLESAEVNATPFVPPSPPAAPTNVAAAASDSANVISWPAVPGSNTYNLYFATTSPVTVANGNLVRNVTSPFRHGGLTNGTTYYYVLTAVNAIGESAPSAMFSAAPTSAPQAPTAPTSVVAQGGNGQVAISWNPVAGANSYIVYWATSSGVSKLNGNKITGVSSPYTHTGLTVGSYFYVVTAANANGESIESAPASATVVTPPGAPGNVVAAAGNAQVTLTWSAVSGATSYNVYHSATSGVTRTNGAKIAGVTSPYTHTGLTNGATRFYAVTAQNANGESVESLQVSAQPAAPTNWVGTGTPKLVFIRSGDVWMMDTNGSNATQVTSIGGATFPRLSNGIIAFKKNNQLYRTDVTGTAPVAIPNLADVYQYDLSPDGTKVVFSPNAENSFVLYRINIDGTGLTMINDGRPASMHQVWTCWGRNGFIYFADGVYGAAFDAANHSLYRIAENAAAGAAVKMMSDYSQMPAEAGPNNLLFFRRNPTTTNLWCSSVDGTNARAVPNADAGFGVITADQDQEIAYYSLGTQIWKINADGTGKTLVYDGIDANANYVDYGKTGPAATPITIAWSGRAPMPTARAGGATAVLNGIIYTVGGYDGVPPNPGTGAKFEAYDVAGNSWTSKPNYPRSDGRYGMPMVAAGNGRLYVFGGTNIWGNYNVNTIDEFDPASNSWTLNKGVLPNNLGNMAATSYDGTIYLFGGGEYNGPIHRECYRFDHASGTLTAIASLPIGLLGAKAVTVGTKIYLIGGYDGSNWLKSVFVYDVPGNSWTRKADGAVAYVNVIGEYKGKIYVPFYYDIQSPGYRYDPAYEYDPVADSWRTVAKTGNCSDRLPPPGNAGPFGAIVGDSIFLIGGQTATPLETNAVDRGQLTN